MLSDFWGMVYDILPFLLGNNFGGILANGSGFWDVATWYPSLKENYEYDGNESSLFKSWMQVSSKIFGRNNVTNLSGLPILDGKSSRAACKSQDF